MHIEHKAGDKLYVDFTGVKQSIIHAATGEMREAEVFVGVLGSSQKALEMKVYTCKIIRNTLKNKTFNLNIEQEIQRIINNNETRGLDILN